MEKSVINLNREIVLNDYQTSIKKNKELFINGDVKASCEYIYDNQKEDASRICNKFYETSIRAISIVKRTKVGMDGLMIEIAKNITTHPDDNFVLHRNNVFIITGMSNVSWEDDMKNKIPSCFKDNVYHHGQLQKLKTKFKDIKNAIIIIDEIDTGDGKNQKLHKSLNWLLDIKYIEEHNIRFVFVSATIIREIKQLKKWGDKHDTYYMTIPDSYISHKDFLELGVIQEYYPVNSYKSAEKWIHEDILSNYKNDFRVHIIRTDETNKDFISKVCEDNNIDFRNHTSVDRITNEELLSIFDNVKNHLVIAVKGFYRRANLIPNEWKKKIGAVHEKYVENPDANVQIQGLSGRMTGYWKKEILNGHKTGPYRTSIDAIKKYEEFYENPLSDSNLILRPKEIFLAPKNIKNLEIIEVLSNKRIPVIIEGLEENDKIFTEKKKKEKIKTVLSKIQKIVKYENLYNFILHPDTKCVQITTPESTGSYKRHITDVVNASINNTPYSIDLKEKHTKFNNWQVFIDNKQKRLCFVIWSITDLY